MDIVEATQIYNFGNTSPKADFESSPEPIIEIPLSEFKHILEDLTVTYNLVAETIRDRGILRGRELL